MNSKKINDVAKAIVTETAEAVNITQAMIADAELAARAEVEAKHYTSCRYCQAAFVNWRIANPKALCTEVEAHHAFLWEHCGACAEEYSTWINSQAERHELESLGTDYLHAVNGDDLRWQNGGVK